MRTAAHSLSTAAAALESRALGLKSSMRRTGTRGPFADTMTDRLRSIETRLLMAATGFHATARRLHAEADREDAARQKILRSREAKPGAG
ncbi:hypothetical protein OJ998_19850 [Solirubrobacter taibaiensis]|nr:hypothetical protein [Solirubrobacter taibaiensis]